MFFMDVKNVTVTVITILMVRPAECEQGKRQCSCTYGKVAIYSKEVKCFRV